MMPYGRQDITEADIAAVEDVLGRKTGTDGLPFPRQATQRESEVGAIVVASQRGLNLRLLLRSRPLRALVALSEEDIALIKAHRLEWLA